MQLSPRYGKVPPVDMVADRADIEVPFLRQQRRLAATVAELTDEQMATPSRCEGWTVANVLTHLVEVNGFWLFSLAGAVAGTPTQVLNGFDPEASPRTSVERTGALDPAVVRDQFGQTVSALCAAIEQLDDEAWGWTAEAPPGHVTVTTMVHHALWDCWIHERDIVVPLGLEPVEEADELACALAYSAGVSVAFGVWADATRSGRLVVAGGDPSVELVVDIGSTVSVSRAAGQAGSHDTTDSTGDVPILRGRTVDLVEGLSQRAPLDHDLAAEDEWMLNGLHEVFTPAD